MYKRQALAVCGLDGAGARLLDVLAPGRLNMIEDRLRASQANLSSGDAFGEIDVQLAARTGVIHPDLRVGANLGAAHTLRANTGVSSMGYILGGRGFVLDPAQANELSRSSVGARRGVGYSVGWGGRELGLAWFVCAVCSRLSP